MPCVELTVTDNGCGMAPEILSSAFEPFFTTKKPGQGTGLRLATACSLAKLHGGTIVAESEPGSRYAGFLAPAAQIEGATFLNLLIVDDERAIPEVCREIAQSLGFNTVVADSAEHAYRMLESQNICGSLHSLLRPSGTNRLFRSTAVRWFQP